MKKIKKPMAKQTLTKIAVFLGCVLFVAAAAFVERKDVDHGPEYGAAPERSAYNQALNAADIEELAC